jgi:drug/metabolite transporter (DMT)-like permease
VAGIGLFGYGVSLVLFVRALRYLGTARTAACFSTAPFVGTALAFAMGQGRLDGRFALQVVGLPARSALFGRSQDVEPDDS